MGKHLKHAEKCRFLMTQVPFVKSLGISCEKTWPGYAVARWKRDPQWLRPGGYLFGGGVMSLADAALYMAILGQIGLKARAVTIELKMNFLRPAIGGDVPAHAQVLKVGQHIAYGQVRLFNGGGSGQADRPCHLQLRDACLVRGVECGMHEVTFA